MGVRVGRGVDVGVRVGVSVSVGDAVDDGTVVGVGVEAVTVVPQALRASIKIPKSNQYVLSFLIAKILMMDFWTTLLCETLLVGFLHVLDGFCNKLFQNLHVHIFEFLDIQT